MKSTPALCDVIIENVGSAYAFRAETNKGQQWLNIYAPSGIVAPRDFDAILRRGIVAGLAIWQKP
jgi:hypothetical protein